MIEWRPNGAAEWIECDKEGGHTWEERKLSEWGRKKLLERFGLADMGRELPLEVVRTMCPAKMHALRCKYEREHYDAPMVRLRDQRPGGSRHDAALVL